MMSQDPNLLQFRVARQEFVTELRKLFHNVRNAVVLRNNQTAQEEKPPMMVRPPIMKGSTPEEMGLLSDDGKIGIIELRHDKLGRAWDAVTRQYFKVVGPHSLSLDPAAKGPFVRYDFKQGKFILWEDEP